jgi:hypothetical protein
MAMTLAAQRAGLVALLQTVPGIGRIHDYRRIVRNENDVRQLFVPANSPDGQVNVWMIYQAPNSTTVSERHPGHIGIGVKGGGNVMTTFQWQIDGYMAIDDAAGSEKTFGDLAWAIADELNSYGALGISGITHQLPADVEQLSYIALAGIGLYHYARIGVGFQGRTRPA